MCTGIREPLLFTIISVVFLLHRYLKQLCLYANGSVEDGSGMYCTPHCWYRSDQQHKLRVYDCGGITHFSGFTFTPTRVPSRSSSKEKRYYDAPAFFRDLDVGRWKTSDLAMARAYASYLFCTLLHIFKYTHFINQLYLFNKADLNRL